jgi:hypothetical protein
MLFTYEAHSPLVYYPYILRLSFVINILRVIVLCCRLGSRRVVGHAPRSRFARLWCASRREESSSKASWSMLTTIVKGIFDDWLTAFAASLDACDTA